MQRQVLLKQIQKLEKVITRNRITTPLPILSLYSTYLRQVCNVQYYQYAFSFFMTLLVFAGAVETRKTKGTDTPLAKAEGVLPSATRLATSLFGGRSRGQVSRSVLRDMSTGSRVPLGTVDSF